MCGEISISFLSTLTCISFINRVTTLPTPTRLCILTMKFHVVSLENPAYLFMKFQPLLRGVFQRIGVKIVDSVKIPDSI